MRSALWVSLNGGIRPIVSVFVFVSRRIFTMQSKDTGPEVKGQRQVQ